MRKELLEGLSEEQIAKAKECKNSDLLLQLAKEEGIELNDEQLKAVSGGGCPSAYFCPKCGSDYWRYKECDGYYSCKCDSCGYRWKEDK